MKLSVFYVPLLVLVISGCDGLLSDQAADALSKHASGDATASSTYYVGINMKGVPFSNETETINTDDATFHLAIHRDSSGNPTCVFLKKATESIGTAVVLEDRGGGEWKINASDSSASATYARYGSDFESGRPALELNWTVQRGDRTEANMVTEPKHRLEYFSAHFANAKYEYSYDRDSASGLGTGEPNDISTEFGKACGNSGNT